MSKIKPSRADAALRIADFAGIGAGGALSGKGAADLCNFRIRTDGTLETRAGYRRLTGWESGSVRAFWEGTLENTSYCFAVCGAKIYRLEPPTFEAVAVGSLLDSVGSVRFVCYCDALFLLDGNAILTYRSALDTFEAVVPYAPLYGRNWSPTDLGEINEPFNLLSNCLRIHYLNMNGATAFYLPYYAQRVDAVRVDNVQTTEFTFTANSNYVVIPSAASATEVEIAIFVKVDENTRLRMLWTRDGYIHEEDGEQHLLLYGGLEDYRIYCSVPLDGGLLNACKVFYPETDPLYFRAEDILLLGDSAHPPHTLCPHYGGILALSDRKGWLLQQADGVMEATVVLNGLGCAVAGAAVSCGN
ncbi:MAG: hypothetical protein IJW92_03000, partial [Clostridia bacterium]|nr:hypothetical protein [Clostridia bacterium]